MTPAPAYVNPRAGAGSAPQPGAVPPIQKEEHVNTGTVLPPAGERVRPFGLTLALPAEQSPADELESALSLCPERQIAVTQDGEPFIDSPSMKTSFTTSSQTREDMQLATDSENDTDKSPGE
jgi:putative ATP-grasp target RiPP